MSLSPRFFLSALDLRDRSVVVFGGGPEAHRRAGQFLCAGARVTVVTTAPGPELLGLMEHPSCTLLQKAPEVQDLDGKWLAVLAEENDQLARELGAAAAARRLFFCAVDQPEQNSFAHVGIAQAGALQLGVSTSGEVPGLAGVLTRQLQALLDRSALAGFVEGLIRLRQETPRTERRRVLAAALARLRLQGEFVLQDDATEDPVAP